MSALGTRPTRVAQRGGLRRALRADPGHGRVAGHRPVPRRRPSPGCRRHGRCGWRRSSPPSWCGSASVPIGPRSSTGSPTRPSCRSPASPAWSWSVRVDAAVRRRVAPRPLVRSLGWWRLGVISVVNVTIVALRRPRRPTSAGTRSRPRRTWWSRSSTRPRSSRRCRAATTSCCSAPTPATTAPALRPDSINLVSIDADDRRAGAWCRCRATCRTCRSPRTRRCARSTRTATTAARSACSTRCTPPRPNRTDLYPEQQGPRPGRHDRRGRGRHGPQGQLLRPGQHEGLLEPRRRRRRRRRWTSRTRSPCSARTTPGSRSTSSRASRS